MPRSGAGVYTPTSGIPVVSGTTISSTVFNNIIDDLGDEITASLPVAGTAPMTGALRATLGSASAPGYTFTGDVDTGMYSAGANTLNFATSGTLALTISSTQTTTWAGKAVGKAFDVDAVTSVASAATCDIGAAATGIVNITGTTTITSFGTSNAGILRRGYFAAALTLTHNGTSLILPGAASITTAANDRFEALSLGSGNWIVTSYVKANGQAVINPTLTLSDLPAGTIVQRSVTEYASNTDLSTTVPIDDTSPTNSEGTSVISVSFTPKSATNKLILRFSGTVASSSTAITAVASIYADGVIVGSGMTGITSSTVPFNLVVEKEMTAGTTSAITFTVRVGSSATIRMNGTSSARLFGGSAVSSLVIEELKV